MSALKKWLIAGLILVLGGGLIFAIGMSKLDWDFYELDTAEYEERSFEPDEGESITGVDISVGSFPVTVQAGEKVSLVYYESDDSEASVSVEDGKLTVKETGYYKFYKHGMFQLKRAKLRYVLTVPDGVDLSVSGPNGDVKISGLSLGSVNIKSTNVDVIMTECNMPDLYVTSTNADVILRSCVSGAVTVNGTNLDLSVKNCTFESLESKSTNGDIEMRDTVCPSVNMRSTNADYSLKNITADIIELHGTNLDADILVNGVKEEYTVLSSGRDLPASRTGTVEGKTITLGGTNCDVELRFTN